MSQPRLPVSAVSAAAVGVIIGFGGTIALVVEAGRVMGASPAQVVSMITALCLGIGVGGVLLSWRFRTPIILAWSTPGAALLAATSYAVTWPTAVGAFVVAGALMVLTGLVPVLGRLASHIPRAIASAMLAGVLLPFCIRLFQTFPDELALSATLFATFLIVRRAAPTWAMPVVLVAALGVFAMSGKAQAAGELGVFGGLAPTTPRFDLATAVSLGVPLFIVTLVSQNLPGLAVLRVAGYEPPAGPLLLSTGAATLLLAPFGGYGLNLAAIVAAICTGEDAHPDRDRRWIVGLIYGGVYLGVALFAAPVAGLFMAMPAGLLAVITGLALLSPLAGALVASLEDQVYVDVAVITFATTASGVVLFGVGAAFWGLAAGAVALAVRRWVPQLRASVGR